MAAQLQILILNSAEYIILHYIHVRIKNSIWNFKPKLSSTDHTHQLQIFTFEFFTVLP